MKESAIDAFVQVAGPSQFCPFDGRHAPRVFHQFVLQLGVVWIMQLGVCLYQQRVFEDSDPVVLSLFTGIFDAVNKILFDGKKMTPKQRIVETARHVQATFTVARRRRVSQRRCGWNLASKPRHNNQTATFLDFSIARLHRDLIAFRSNLRLCLRGGGWLDGSRRCGEESCQDDKHQEEGRPVTKLRKREAPEGHRCLPVVFVGVCESFLKNQML